MSSCPDCGTGSKIHPVGKEACSRSYWQPIETAPKDGRTVFIWYGGECVHAAFLGDSHGRIPNWYLLDMWRNWGLVSDLPKYWMPLPEPPQ